MCGIFGYVASAESPGVLDIEEATRALAHRGPDGAGRFAGVAGGTRCELTHTRLAVIDLSAAGRQPMQSADGRYVIVFNGEIYNFRELGRELKDRGVRLKSSSDTEVVLEGFAFWGPKLLERLRGMFAFAIWDSLVGELFLARDRIGIKPLYITEKSGLFAFASEVRTLLRAGAAPRKLCLESLRSYLRWGSVAEPLTIIEGVTALPPGCYLRVRRDARELSRYWEPRISPTQNLRFEDAVDMVRPVLRDAVALHLITEVPLGIFLSGGIDSSAIAALASAEQASRPRTFNVSFDDAPSSEAAYASEVAARLGCSHEQLVLHGDRVRAELVDAFDALDQPSADGVNTFFVAKAVRAAGIKVALSGLGGDEVFAGYGYFRAFEKLMTLRGWPLMGHGKQVGDLIDRLTRPGASSRSRKLAELVAGNRDIVDTYSALRCMFTRRQVAALVEGPRAAGEDATVPRAARAAFDRGDADAVNVFSVMELGNYLRNTLLRDSDSMSMAHGLELRVPFLDHRLLEVVLPIAARTKLSAALNKPLLVAAAPALPEIATRRRKMGFSLPFDRWLRGPLRSTLEEFTSPSCLGNLGVDSSIVKQYWEEFQRGTNSGGASRLICLATLSHWCTQNRTTG